MRGAVPIEVPVPVGGWNRSVPRQKLPPTNLFDGLNLLVGQDGFLSPRPGYEHLQAQPVATAADKRIMQGIGFADTNGNEQVVVATLTQWFRLQSGAWFDITGTPFTSDKDTAVRLVVFGSLNNQSALYGVNGYFHDDLRRWLVGDPTSLVVVNEASSGPTSLAANDLDVVADRLVVVNTQETGGGEQGHNPNFVRWSSVLNGASWPALAFNPLAGIGSLVAVRAVSRTAAVVYGQTGAYIMAGTPGDDAGAFVFDRIEGVTVGPVNPNAIVSIGGVHWYVGTDSHIWKCDGQNAEIVSMAIDAVIGPGATAPSLATQPEQRPVIIYDGSKQRIWFFGTFQGQQEAYGALVWNLHTQAWEVPQQFANAITAAFPVIEQNAPTWDEPGVHAVTTLSGNVNLGDTMLPLVDSTGFPVPGVASLPVYDVELNTGELVEYPTIFGNTLVFCTRGMTYDVWTPTGFVTYGNAAGVYGIGEPVTSEITWDDAGLLWPNWNGIPNSNAPIIYVGDYVELTQRGFVSRFGLASTDAVEQNTTLPIDYFAQWGLISSPNTTQEIQINTGDVYLQPVTGDDARLTVKVQRTPYPTAVPVQILDQLLVGDDDETWLFRLDATIATAAFKPGNYLDVVLRGSSLMGGMRFAGMTLYADIRMRPDRLRGVPGLSGVTAQ